MDEKSRRRQHSGREQATPAVRAKQQRWISHIETPVFITDNATASLPACGGATGRGPACRLITSIATTSHPSPASRGGGRSVESPARFSHNSCPFRQRHDRTRRSSFPALGAVYAALAPWVEALLRFAVGAAMMPHGLRMSLGYFKGTGGPPGTLASVVQMYDRKGFRPGWFWAYCTVLTQFIAAPCVALGPAHPADGAAAVPAAGAVRRRPRQIRRLVLEQDRASSIRRCGRSACSYFLINGGGLISLDHLLGFEFWEDIMADNLAQARHDLAVANRVVSLRGHHRRLRPCQHAPSDQAGPLSDLALALARGGRGRRHLRIHARQRAGDAAAATASAAMASS